MECILYPEQYKIIYNVSFLSLGSCMYAIYNGYYCLSICPGGVFLTSINYWRHPDYSWRRYLDMTYVKLSFIYHGNTEKFQIPYRIVILLDPLVDFSGISTKRTPFFISAEVPSILNESEII